MPILPSLQLLERNIFSDASVKAIAAVADFRVINRECHTGFVLGTVALASQAAHTILQLELGALVLASEIAESIAESAICLKLHSISESS